jgi:hypothetical protein
VKPGGPSEKEFLAGVRGLARLCRWREYHTHDSRRSAPGFPDLVLVRERVVFAELKSEAGKLTPEQVAWANALAAAGAEVHVWRPRNWDEIIKVLK